MGVANSSKTKVLYKKKKKKKKKKDFEDFQMFCFFWLILMQKKNRLPNYSMTMSQKQKVSN